jgi:hypothetical protein
VQTAAHVTDSPPKVEGAKANAEVWSVEIIEVELTDTEILSNTPTGIGHDLRQPTCTYPRCCPWVKQTLLPDKRIQEQWIDTKTTGLTSHNGSIRGWKTEPLQGEWERTSLRRASLAMRSAASNAG